MTLQDCQTSHNSLLRWIRSRLLDDAILISRRGNPTEYTRQLKWFVTLMLASASLIESLMVIILYPALPQIAADLHTTNSIGNLASTLCDIGPAIAPLYWSLLSEKYGRRISCLLSLTAFTLFTGLGGTAQNVWTLIIFRVLASFCGCAVSVIGSAVVADMWEVKERGYAMSVFCLGLLCGTAIGPLLGGILVYTWNWRAIQWFLTAYAALSLLLELLFLPETLVTGTAASNNAVITTIENQTAQSPKTSTRDYGNSIDIDADSTITASTITTQSSFGRIFQPLVSILSPLSAVRYLKFPVILLITYLSAISLVAIIVTFVSIQSVFSAAPYKFNYLILGLMYIPMPLGMICGGLAGGKWSDRIMAQEVDLTPTTEDIEPEIKQRTTKDAVVIYKPEVRLRENALLSTVLIPAMLLFYGWTVQYKLSWFIPVIPMFLMSFGTGLTFSLATTMLTEFVPHRSATMVALDSLVKNLFAAAGGSSAQPLIDNIGNGWLFTALSAILLFSVPIVLTYRRYGRAWRETMDEAEGIVRHAQVSQQAATYEDEGGASIASVSKQTAPASCSPKLSIPATATV